MWILLRLAAAGVGFLIRLGSRFAAAGEERVFEGHRYNCHVSKKKGQVTSFRLSMAFPKGVVFGMTCERSWDAFFKSLGFSAEYQTGDATFDDKVYIACDNPAFCHALKNQPRHRELLLEFFAAGFYRIRSDGNRLMIEAKRELPDKWVVHLPEAQKLLLAALADTPSYLSDPFVWRALLVEAVIWSLAGYAVASGVDFAVHKQDFHVKPYSVIGYGVCASIALMALLMFAIVVFLQRSSRSHRILIESFVALLLSLPIAGIQLVSDLNRGLDGKPSLMATVEVQRAYEQVHRGRRGRRWYTYHMEIGPADSPVLLPLKIDISRTVYTSIQARKPISIEMGPGFLGLPWYRKINGINCSAL